MTAELHSFIADVLHGRGLLDRDGFALRSANSLSSLRTWNESEIRAAVERVRTDLFRRYPSWTRDQVLELIASRVARRWKTSPNGANASSARTKILFVGANPITEISPGICRTPLALEEEIREIHHKIQASKYRDLLDLVPRMAARPDDLIQAFNEIQPRIVHLSSHGTGTEELVLLNKHGKPQVVSKSAIKALFKTMRDNIRVVVLNACFSRGQAAAITEHVDCAVGMKRAIGDEAAITFAASLYRAIGFGRSVRQSFEQGLVALQLAGIPEHSTPKLLCRKGVDPDKVILTGEQQTDS